MKDDTLSLPGLSDDQRREVRRVQNRQAKRRSRQNLGVQKQITVELTAAEFAELQKLARRSRRGSEGFWRRALIQGALFVSNAGQAERVKLVDVPALQKALEPRGSLRTSDRPHPPVEGGAVNPEPA